MVIPLVDLDIQRRLSKVMMKQVKKVQKAQKGLDINCEGSVWGVEKRRNRK